MTSWTAEVEWHEDLKVGGHHGLVAVLGQDLGSVQSDYATGTMTATVTMEAPDLCHALDAVLLLVTGLTGHQVTVNRITASDACCHESAPVASESGSQPRIDSVADVCT